MALQYHAGQIEVQDEANTRPVADMLAGWVGPVGEFSSVADLLVFATPDGDGDLRFVTVSGPAPLVEITGSTTIRIPGLALAGNEDVMAGGLATSLAQLRRARINGRLIPGDEGWSLETMEAFTNCRKYIAPSMAIDATVRSAPVAVEPVSWDDRWLSDLIATAETTFLASISPDGLPDVSHRGGQPGFIRPDASSGQLIWPEYIGDGMFKTAGNVRATGCASLLVLDLHTGDAAELVGKASYMTLKTRSQARSHGLERHRDPYPVQGEMSLSVRRARRLRGLFAPRERMAKAQRVNSCSPIDDQAPR